MNCPEGQCEGIHSSSVCCFECDWREQCPAEIKCDQPELHKKGICKAEMEEVSE